MGLALLAVLVLSVAPVQAGDDPAGLVGSPASVAIVPSDATLLGRRATRQLIVSATYADGTVRDLTRALEWISLDPEIAAVSPKGQVVPRGNGTATIVARRGSVEVQDDGQGRGDGAAGAGELPPRRDPRLQPGRLQHGGLPRHADRQGGLPAQPSRLPARPGLHHPQPRGRRPADQPVRRRDQPDPPQAARASCPTRGACGSPASTKTYEFLHDWIAEGAKDDPDAPAAVRLEILPGTRVLNAPATTQQIVVLVHLADGTVRDVTPICYYDSSNPEIAEVDADGYVRFKTRGEVAIIAHYLDLVANVRLTHLVEVPGFRAAEVPQDNVIDRAVFAKLNRMRISPSEPCTDARVHPPRLPRRDRRAAHAPTRSRRSWPTRRPTAAPRSSTGCWTGPSSTTSGP